MMENIKTLILALLIVFSLVQSYLLSYSSPKFDPINQRDYVQAELFGTKIEMSRLIFPEQIIIHTGDESHHVLYPEMTYYDDILDNIQQTTFDGFRRVLMQFSEPDWEEVRAIYPGIELRFRDGLPFDVLQSMMQIKIDNAYDQEIISKIWIYKTENPQEIKTYFLSKSGTELYEAVKTNITVNDIDRFVSRGRFLPQYHPSVGDSYLPLQPIKLRGVEFSYSQYSAEELKKSLFVDPGITRNITEWDGSEIYTDGKRGLQIKNDLRWMTYSDPVAPMGARSSFKADLSASVLFINQHGGWNNKYIIEQIPDDSDVTDQEQTIIFRQYYESFPVMNDVGVYYGYMKVSLQRGVIYNYERSIIVPERETLIETDMWLLGGEDLEDRLRKISVHQIRSIRAVYRPEVTDETVNLIPAWAIQYNNGNVVFIDGVYVKPEPREKEEIVEPNENEADDESKDELQEATDAINTTDTMTDTPTSHGSQGQEQQSDDLEGSTSAVEEEPEQEDVVEELTAVTETEK